jgi:general secretion pathway protein A
MYEAHFGLKSRPFGSKAEGTGIFVGPQQMKVISSLHKALAAPDAVVTVTGPVGVGKTTIVSRALESISPGRTAAWVGRMQLSPEEVLELLLAGFGIQGKSKGTIQKFTAFRRLLGNQAAAGARVAIIVEDAQKISPGALAELEAMTAADNGDTASANIILMGQPGLNQLLSTPELARMKQRNRLRQSVEAFSLAEVTGYLKHSIREAGGQYDAIFDEGVADIVYACSEGIPRVINTMCATALETAAEEGSARITAALMHQVAVDAFGYDGPIPDALPTVVEAKAAAEPVPVETKPETTPVASEAKPEITPVASETKTEPKPEPVAAPKPEAMSAQACEPELDREPAAAAGTEVPAEVETTAQQTEAAPKLPENATAEERAEDELPPTARNLVVESGRYPVIPESAVESAEPAAPVFESASVDSIKDDEPDLEIPELINDTQPELNRLEVPDEPGEPAPVVEDAPKEKTGSTAVMEKLPEALAAKAEKPESAIDEPRSASVSGDDEEADFDLDAALSIDAGETNVMRGITPNLDTLAAEPRAQRPAPEPKPTVKTEAESRPEPAPGFTIAQVEAENELPSLDDLPTLSDSMRVDVDKEVGRAQELEAKNTPAPEAPAAPVAKTSPAAEVPAAPVAKTRPAPIAQVSELTARIATLDPSSRDGEVDALEAALDAAKKSDFAAMTSPGSAPAVNSSAEQDLPDLIPEITLDKVLPDQPDNDEELQKLAAEIGNASSLEDMSDMMAETLFGSQAFEKIAAAVVANPPADHELADAPPEGPSPVKLELEAELDPSPTPGAANDTVEPDEGEVALKESVALRIDMLNAMKGKVADRPAEKVVLGGNGLKDTSAPKPNGPQPEPIENQINTSITQTLEALDISKVADKLGDDHTKEKQKKSGGLFSRFRKSS